MYKLNGRDDIKEGNIFNRSNIQRLATSYTLPESEYIKEDKNGLYNVMLKNPEGIAEVALLSAITDKEFLENTESGQKTKLNNLETILTPPNEKFSDVLPPEAMPVATQVESLATKQFIQQFYETYMAPVGQKDVYNRLGVIAGNINDIHLLYPNGLKGIIAADARGSWRTNLNFAFTVNTGIKNSNGQAIKEKYSSLAFPPFIQHKTANANDLLNPSKEITSEEDSVKNNNFDMDNILYKRNAATFRFPAFKQVNDNIHTLQVLLNRCFGIESTFMNEWDLSMYMQEGLTSFIEKADANGSIIRVPQFVTTLTYGLLDDAPTELLKERGKNAGYADVDLDVVSPFASVNLAISTRFGLDNQPLGCQANETEYIISNYPYSAYWYPWDDGVRVDDFNVATYIDQFFSYRANGMTYDEKHPKARIYTPAIFHGGDLSRSTKRFLQILNYTDSRNAILSGWNATKDDGSNYLADSDTTNESTKSNAYSYLPFWKQFFTTGEDGMSDVDLYLQEVLASDRECSFINASHHIINIIAGSNDIFQDACEAAAQKRYEEEIGRTLGEDEAFNMVIPSKYGSSDGDYKDMKFSLFKCKLKIPGSKLLSMFMNKSKNTSKAMAAANSAGSSLGGMPGAENGGSGSSGGSDPSPVNALKNATPTKKLNNPKTIIVDGKEVIVDEYIPEDNDELCSKKVVGDGVAEYSPFIYGGPHGKYLSPLTLEGYTQVGNQTLANVPTVDTYALFNGIRSEIGVRGFEFSKNFKRNGSYIDHVVALTPNEREALIKGSSSFGVRNMGPNTRHIVPYTSNWYVRDYFHDWTKWIRSYGSYYNSNYNSGSSYSYGSSYGYYRTPNMLYYKMYRAENGRLHSLKYFPYDYGTGKYSTRSHTTRVEYSVSYQEDWWDTDFKLLPTCGWQQGFWEGSETGGHAITDNRWGRQNSSLDGAWTLGQTLDRIRQDQATFRRPTEWYSNSKGEPVYTWKPGDNHIASSNIKWMIVPGDQSSGLTSGRPENDRPISIFGFNIHTGKRFADQRWLHWATYNSAGTKWYNQLKNLWNAGTREMSATLPIKDAAGRVIELLCGVINIYKSKNLSWRWRLQRYGWFFTFRHGWGCPHPMFGGYYRWQYKRDFEDAYNAYFRPNKIQWILPTDTLINQECRFNTNSRNPDSANIIERYCTDSVDDNTVKRFSHIGSTEQYSPKLFPFTEDFIQKYGYSEPWTLLPGVSYYHQTRYIGDLKVLHSKGFYWGNILESYRTTGEVQSIVATAPQYQQWTGKVSFTETCAGNKYQNSSLAKIFRRLSGRYYEQGSKYSSERTVVWTSDYPSIAPSQKRRQEELTKILDNCQGYNSIQVYQIGKTPYMTWYESKDTLRVFLDTIMQQIAWLEQLKDYANSFLKDQLIYDVYEKSVDNRVKAIIEYNYNGDVKNGQDYKSAADGWTESFTEDINYHDALAIVRRVFKTEDPNRNTVYDLTVTRLEKLKAIKNYAQKLFDDFDKKPVDYMHLFMRLVTNTKSLLDGVKTGEVPAEEAIFDANGNYQDCLYEVNGTSTYNMLTNPAAVLWAYLNVLYHVRKYWINMRFNKRAGSYWILRGLERVLTFMLASQTGEDSLTAQEKHIDQGMPLELLSKKIQYVQPRTTFDEQIKKLGEFNLVYTKAVYVMVDYLNLPDPKESTKWNETNQTFDGKEIVYIPEKFKWAYKPVDGLYYVMSNTISENVRGLTETLKDTITFIYSKDFELSEIDFENATQGYEPSLKASLKDFIQFNASLATTVEYIKSLTDQNQAALEAKFTNFINDLIEYKRDYFLEQIHGMLYPVYIKWRPEYVWTGLTEDDTTGDWHIDEWQKEDSAGKERIRRDLYGYDHTLENAISAGITFDVVSGLNPETLLSSPSGLRNSSLLEILCSCVDRIDLWRIEIPEKENIPVGLLEDKPILIPAYQIDAAVNGLKPTKIEPTKKSVLAGAVASSILPITEPSDGMLTINTLAALGDFNKVAATDLGLPG